MIHRHFSKVVMKGEFNDRGLPVLLIGNHFSWWDGFIANYLNSEIFHRRFHIMMLEEQLRKRMFLNKTGAFSIQKSSRSVIDSLAYAAELLKERKNLVVLYPQGQFQSVYDRQIKFEKGFVSIPQKVSETGLQLTFYIALIDYFSQRKPLLSLHIREYSIAPQFTAHDLETAYNEFFLTCIKQHKQLL
jgi:1-acyl-sn-glycerol-3-phosphate acyltransferase